MDFTEVVAEVIELTKRPDKIASIRNAVNATIRKACLGAEFARDVVESTVAISSSDYIQSLALTEFPRFRKFVYVRPYGQKCPMHGLSGPLAIYDDDNKERSNVYYVAGDNVVFRLYALADTLYYGYLAAPPVLTDASPDFWLLELEPYMIIDGAAAKIFRNIGDDRSAQQHEADFRLAYDSARVDLKYGVALNV